MFCKLTVQLQQKQNLHLVVVHHLQYFIHCHMSMTQETAKRTFFITFKNFLLSKFNIPNTTICLCGEITVIICSEALLIYHAEDGTRTHVHYLQYLLTYLCF